MRRRRWPATGAASRSRSALPPSVARVPSPSRRSAASASRASCASRTAIGRGRTGPPSRITSANPPLRSRRSAHHAPREGSGGRTTHAAARSDASDVGSSVRCASIQATPCPARSVWAASWRASVVFPAPAGAIHSLMRPRGIPPPTRTSSRRVSPVGRPGACEGVPATTDAMRRRRAASDIPKKDRRKGVIHTEQTPKSARGHPPRVPRATADGASVPARYLPRMPPHGHPR